MLRVTYEQVLQELVRVLLKHGFTAERADLCARLYAQTELDGVTSHGLRRFPALIASISQGVIDPSAQPQLVGRFGAIEQWDGRHGPGNLNAHASMARAIELAHEQSMGCVALRRTNHWGRAGNYGWQAADADMIGLCWTNTTPNMPPWGGAEPRLGNNPLVIAVPRPAGHVVLDIAMTQFSMGRLGAHARRGEPLPVDGGYDEQGRLTRDAAAIQRSGRTLPIGYWKGSGLSLMLDLLAALLAQGQATHQIAAHAHEEGVSQVFIAIDVARLPGGLETAAAAADEIIAYTCAAKPASEGEQVQYPGQQSLATRRKHLAEGIPVDPQVWEQVQAL